DGGRLEGELDGVAVDDAVADVVVLEAGLGEGVEGAEVYLGPGAGVTDDGADDVRLDRAAAAARVAGGEEDERCGEQQDGAQDVLQVLGFPFCLVASRAYLAWTDKVLADRGTSRLVPLASACRMSSMTRRVDPLRAGT